MTKEELEKEAIKYGKKATAWLEDREPLDQRDIENAYLAGAEPREKRIEELEYQLTHRNCLDCSNHSSKLRMRNLDLEKENAELEQENKVLAQNLEDTEIVNKALEKENAILKEQVSILDNCDRLGDVITEEYKEQLTKAKEIIREFVEWATWQGSNCPDFKSIQDKAEAFLNSEVEK